MPRARIGIRVRSGELGFSLVALNTDRNGDPLPNTMVVPLHVCRLPSALTAVSVRGSLKDTLTSRAADFPPDTVGCSSSGMKPCFYNNSFKNYFVSPICESDDIWGGINYSFYL